MPVPEELANLAADPRSSLREDLSPDERKNGKRNSGKRPATPTTVTQSGGMSALLEQIPEISSPNLTFLKHTMLDAIVTEEKIQSILAGSRQSSSYPNSGLGNSLRNIAALIAADLPTRVYFALPGGFDTHSNQAPPMETSSAPWPARCEPSRRTSKREACPITCSP
jgi:hypothetical protein